MSFHNLALLSVAVFGISSNWAPRILQSSSGAAVAPQWLPLLMASTSTTTTTSGAPYSAPLQPVVETFASAEEWAELYRWRLRRAVGMIAVVQTGNLGDKQTRLRSAVALAIPEASTYYKYTGLWHPSHIAFQYIMFFSVFDQISEAFFTLTGSSLGAPATDANAIATVDILLDAFDAWFDDHKTQWPQLTFVANDGQRREFRKDRVYFNARQVGALHADAQGVFQRIGEGISEFQIMFEPNSDIINAVHYASSEGIVLETFAEGFWTVKGPQQFCEQSLHRCAHVEQPPPYPSVSACVADVSSTPLFMCNNSIAGLGRSKMCKLLHATSSLFGEAASEKHCSHWGSTGGPDPDGVSHCQPSECGVDWDTAARARSPGIDLPSLVDLNAASDLSLCTRESTSVGCTALWDSFDTQCTSVEAVMWRNLCDVDSVVSDTLTRSVSSTCVSAVAHATLTYPRCSQLATHPITGAKDGFDLRTLYTPRMLDILKTEIEGVHESSKVVLQLFGRSPYSRPVFAPLHTHR